MAKKKKNVVESAPTIVAAYDGLNTELKNLYVLFTEFQNAAQRIKTKYNVTIVQNQDGTLYAQAIVAGEVKSAQPQVSR